MPHKGHPRKKITVNEVSQMMSAPQKKTGVLKDGTRSPRKPENACQHHKSGANKSLYAELLDGKKKLKKMKEQPVKSPLKLYNWNRPVSRDSERVQCKSSCGVHRSALPCPNNNVQHSAPCQHKQLKSSLKSSLKKPQMNSLNFQKDLKKVSSPSTKNDDDQVQSFQLNKEFRLENKSKSKICRKRSPKSVQNDKQNWAKNDQIIRDTSRLQKYSRSPDSFIIVHNKSVADDCTRTIKPNKIPNLIGRNAEAKKSPSPRKSSAKKRIHNKQHDNKKVAKDESEDENDLNNCMKKYLQPGESIRKRVHFGCDSYINKIKGPYSAFLINEDKFRTRSATVKKKNYEHREGSPPEKIEASPKIKNKANKKNLQSNAQKLPLKRKIDSAVVQKTNKHDGPSTNDLEENRKANFLETASLTHIPYKKHTNLLIRNPYTMFKKKLTN